MLGPFSKSLWQQIQASTCNMYAYTYTTSTAPTVFDMPVPKKPHSSYGAGYVSERYRVQVLAGLLPSNNSKQVGNTYVPVYTVSQKKKQSKLFLA